MPISVLTEIVLCGHPYERGLSLSQEAGRTRRQLLVTATKVQPRHATTSTELRLSHGVEWLNISACRQRWIRWNWNRLNPRKTYQLHSNSVPIGLVSNLTFT